MHHSKLFEIFPGLHRAYGQFFITERKGPKLDGYGKTIREKYDETLWVEHLNGKNGLGVIPITEENKCKWGCLDVDDYSVDIEKISKQFVKKNLIVCRSKSGGAHIFVFTKKFVSAKSMIEKLKAIAKAFGFVKYDLRPQQTQLLNDDDVGSWLNMPYFNGDETDRYAVYDGKALSLEHFIQWVEKFSVQSLDDIKLNFIKKENKSNEILPGGPPCLQDLLSQGALGEGGRNNGLFNIGVYLRKKFPEEWQEKLEEYNDEYIDPPLKPREFTSVLNSLDKKTYNYKCKDSPINAVCNKTKCLTCEYGISDDGTMPVLNSITKILTNPPQYFLTLNERKIGPLASKQIYNFLDFKQVVFENLDMLLPKLNDKLWTESVNDLMSRVITVEAPKDSSNEGRLFDLLERFCTGSTSSTEIEDILRGKAIINKEITEFRINDFMEFLDRHRFKEFKLNEITAYLKNLGANHSGKKIKGKFMNVWSIKNFETQDEEFTQPKIEKEAYE
jgi:hypothetical protein|tara:strand:+ start:397 stop:1902 length:1506 start_codon:yes stop_codon:yes gene_type:complete